MKATILAELISLFLILAGPAAAKITTIEECSVSYKNSMTEKVTGPFSCGGFGLVSGELQITRTSVFMDVGVLAILDWDAEYQYYPEPGYEMFAVSSKYFVRVETPPLVILGGSGAGLLHGLSNSWPHLSAVTCAPQGLNCLEGAMFTFAQSNVLITGFELDEGPTSFEFEFGKPFMLYLEVGQEYNPPEFQFSTAAWYYSAYDHIMLNSITDLEGRPLPRAFIAEVPEPSTYALCGLGLGALVLMQRRGLR